LRFKLVRHADAIRQRAGHTPRGRPKFQRDRKHRRRN
jgi:hypothetical protein